MRVIITLFWVLSIAAGEAVAQTPDHNLKDYGAALDGHSLQGQDDNALSAAISAARSGVGSSRVWWRGSLTLRREPPNMAGIQLEGDSMLSASVYKLYPGGVLFRVERPNPVNYRVTAFRNFAVPQAAGTPGSYTILARASSDWAPDCLELRNLYLGSGTGPGPFRSIEINGLARVSPWGIRQPWIQNVTCFGTSGAGNVWIAGTASMYSIGLLVFPAGGTYGDVYLPPHGQGNDLPRVW